MSMNTPCYQFTPSATSERLATNAPLAAVSVFTHVSAKKILSDQESWSSGQKVGDGKQTCPPTWTQSDAEKKPNWRRFSPDFGLTASLWGQRRSVWPPRESRRFFCGFAEFITAELRQAQRNLTTAAKVSRCTVFWRLRPNAALTSGGGRNRDAQLQTFFFLFCFFANAIRGHVSVGGAAVVDEPLDANWRRKSRSKSSGMADGDLNEWKWEESVCCLKIRLPNGKYTNFTVPLTSFQKLVNSATRGPMTQSRYFVVLSVFYWTCGTKIILILSQKLKKQEQPLASTSLCSKSIITFAMKLSHFTPLSAETSRWQNRSHVHAEISHSSCQSPA